MVEVVGSVAPEEVPGHRESWGLGAKWAPLAQRLLDDHAAGQVTVLKVVNRKEVVAARNGLIDPLRRLGYKLRTTSTVKGADEIWIYCEVQQQDGTS